MEESSNRPEGVKGIVAAEIGSLARIRSKTANNGESEKGEGTPELPQIR